MNINERERLIHFLESYDILKLNINRQVENRLEDWGKWFSQNEYRHLGYPSESLEFRHLKSGGVIHSNYALKPMPCHPEAEEMEAIIIYMKLVEPKSTKALCQEYLYQGDQAPKAKELGISLTQYKGDVAIARSWLRGWFHACSAQHKIITIK